MKLTLCTVALLLAQGDFVLGNAILGRAQTTSAACPAEKCYSSIRLKPWLTKPASSFCSSYIKYTAIVTESSFINTTTTITSTNTVTATPAPVTVTSTAYATPAASTVSPTCATTTSTIQGTFTTSVIGYTSRPASSGGVDKRAYADDCSTFTANCGSGHAHTSKISSACSCFLGSTQTHTVVATNIVSKTVTVTATNTASAAQTTVQVTSTLPVVTVTACQTSTTTTTTYSGGAGRTCGVPVVAYTTGGIIQCPASTTAGTEPSATNARFRIEGDSAEGTIFDGPCIASGPENITTPSGGTHLCNGLNENANSSPGGTLTTQINQAGLLQGFDFDGTYDSQFQDFFITRIAESSQTEEDYWGVLRDRTFTSLGGCEELSTPGEGLWVYNAFNLNGFLSLGQEYAVVQPGASITVTVLQTDGNGSNPSPISGATLGGATSNGNGQVTFTAPSSPGCYKYKALLSNYASSPAFFLTVATDL